MNGNDLQRNGKERWKEILQDAKKVWNELSDDAIKSAWDIPRLNELLSDNEDDVETEKNDDEWLPDNLNE